MVIDFSLFLADSKYLLLTYQYILTFLESYIVLLTFLLNPCKKLRMLEALNNNYSSYQTHLKTSDIFSIWNRDEKHNYKTKSNNSVGPNNRVGGKKSIQN